LKVRRLRLSSARCQTDEPRFSEIFVPIRCLLTTSLILSCLSATPMKAAETVTSGVSSSRSTTYKTVAVNGLNIFYREAGPSNAPAILLLHGFPSSSRMFDTLMPLLADRYHLIAPDYPGLEIRKHRRQRTSPIRSMRSPTSLTGLPKLSTLTATRLSAELRWPVGYRVAVAHPER